MQQGTVSKMLEDPGEQIYDVIRYFGDRKKIFDVHFRNFRGHFLNFQETFPDNGSVNMLRVMRTYHEVGYEGIVLPDHAPRNAADTGGKQALLLNTGISPPRSRPYSIEPDVPGARGIATPDITIPKSRSSLV